MFGYNEIVGKKFFNDPIVRDKLLVTSIFLTLQGEGPFAGRPAVFVRLAKCNLACTFCDTYFDTGDWMDVTEVVCRVHDTIRVKFGDNAPRIGAVITGGEPTLQPMMPELCRRLDATGMAFVQIETNGILAPDHLGDETCIVCSPKCVQAHGTKKPLGYIQPHPLMLEQAGVLKFVVSADPESAYHTIPEWAHAWRRERGRSIYISPMNCYLREPALAQKMRDGGSPSLADRNEAEVISFWDNDLLDMHANKANHEYAAQYALAHGYYLSLQMHLFASVA